MSYDYEEQKDCSNVGWGPLQVGFMVMTDQNRLLGESRAEIKE